MEDLLEKQTFACGTLRANSKGLPVDIVPKKGDKLARGSACVVQRDVLWH